MITTLRPLSHFATKYKGPSIVRAAGNGDPMNGVCILHKNRNGDSRGSSIHKNNSKRV